MSHIFSQHDTSRIYDTLQQTQGAGTESSDSTLTEGRAALDVVTRNTLICVSSGNTLLTCLPGEGIN